MAIGGCILAVLIATSIGFFTSVYGAQARDVRFALGYFLGFWFFLTPVIYPLSTIPADYRTLASLNPMLAPIEMVKQGLLGTGEITATSLASTSVFILVVGGLGYWFFWRSEAKAVDSL